MGQMISLHGGSVPGRWAGYMETDAVLHPARLVLFRGSALPPGSSSIRGGNKGKRARLGTVKPATEPHIDEQVEAETSGVARRPGTAALKRKQQWNPAGFQGSGVSIRSRGDAGFIS